MKIEESKERKEMTLREKEIQRHKYIIGKLKKKDYEGLPKEYWSGPEAALEFHERELNEWEKDGDESNPEQDNKAKT